MLRYDVTQVIKVIGLDRLREIFLAGHSAYPILLSLCYAIHATNKTKQTPDFDVTFEVGAKGQTPVFVRSS